MSPGDLRRLAVPQTQVKDHKLTLLWKRSKKKRNNHSGSLWNCSEKLGRDFRQRSSLWHSGQVVSENYQLIFRWLYPQVVHVSSLKRGKRGKREKVSVERLQTTALLKSERILKKPWKSEETCCQSDFSKNHQLRIFWKVCKHITI